MLLLVTLLARMRTRTPALQALLANRKAPLWVDTLRYVGVASFFLYSTLLLVAWTQSLTSLGSITLASVAIVTGYAIADLLSGLVHWISDTYGSRDTPIYGRLYAIPFRDHHDDPTAICREGFVESHGINALSVSALLALAFHGLTFDSGQPIPVALGGITLATSFGVLVAGQSHKWAHQKDVPWLVKHCQEIGLLSHPEAHNLHHDGNHEDHFCIASGWWNGPLYNLRFYRRVEGFLATNFDITPTR